MEVAKAIKRLVDNPSLASEFSAAGIHTIREKYIYEKIIDRIEQYLNDVVSQLAFKSLHIEK
jgi:glycosyltransferase involved in cell wall biosynthesis